MKTTIFTGDYGCGKTLLALHYALRLAHGANRVLLVDADNSKPCFRLRDAVKKYKLPENIDLIQPEGKVAHTDIPTVTHTLGALLKSIEYDSVVLDIPGDFKGRSVLGRLRKSIDLSFELLFVVNTSRPLNNILADIVTHVRKIEMVSGMKVTGLVSNTNIAQETTMEVVLKGFEILLQVSKHLQIPIKMIGWIPGSHGIIPDWDGIYLEVNPPQQFV
ncbi:MAG: hypothetical protein APF76_16810 [Desulfitibacter sp. BRH_c19]|nr:MAG: hypothetical protein APF76_16810 [Desulfitibacter sp. BRH_c19]